MGKGVAIDLARQGWKVIILDYNEMEAKKVANDIDGDSFKVDVRSWREQHQSFETIFSRYGRLDFGESGWI